MAGVWLFFFKFKYFLKGTFFTISESRITIAWWHLDSSETTVCYLFFNVDCISYLLLYNKTLQNVVVVNNRDLAGPFCVSVWPFSPGLLHFRDRTYFMSHLLTPSEAGNDWKRLLPLGPGEVLGPHQGSGELHVWANRGLSLVSTWWESVGLKCPAQPTWGTRYIPFSN